METHQTTSSSASRSRTLARLCRGCACAAGTHGEREEKQSGAVGREGKRVRGEVCFDLVSSSGLPALCVLLLRLLGFFFSFLTLLPGLFLWRVAATGHWVLLPITASFTFALFFAFSYASTVTFCKPFIRRHTNTYTHTFSHCFCCFFFVCVWLNDESLWNPRRLLRLPFQAKEKV